MSSKKVKLLLKKYQELFEFKGTPLKSVNQQGGFKSTPLHIAIYREKIEEVDILLAAGANPNAAGEYDERPLQVAINCGNSEILEKLLKAGAQCNLTDNKGTDTWKYAELMGYGDRLKEMLRRLNITQQQ